MREDSVAPSNHETFWQHEHYAVIGHSEKRPFPRLTYGALKKLGHVVFAIDPSRDTIEGDTAYHDLSELPRTVDGVVIEVPRDEAAGWVERAGRAGIKDVWLHQRVDSPEAITIARRHNINLRCGMCAVMYLTAGFSAHGVHRWICKLQGKY